MTPITDAQITEWERQVHGENANYVTVTLAPILIDALRSLLADVGAYKRESAAGWDEARRLRKEDDRRAVAERNEARKA